VTWTTPPPSLLLPLPMSLLYRERRDLDVFDHTLRIHGVQHSLAVGTVG